MRSEEFIFKNLEGLKARFPLIKFRHQYDELQYVHLVEVTPIDIYLENQAYKEAEGDLTYEFDRTFAPETIMFISLNSLTKITQ